MISIDGDHSYERCSADLRDYIPKLEPQGAILCDDDQWEGAGRAIDEFVAASGRHFVPTGNKALIAPNLDLGEIRTVIERQLARNEKTKAEGA